MVNLSHAVSSSVVKTTHRICGLGNIVNFTAIDSGQSNQQTSGPAGQLSHPLQVFDLALTPLSEGGPSGAIDAVARVAGVDRGPRQ